LRQALSVNLSNVAAVRHASHMVGLSHRGRVKARPCYVSLGRVDDDHGGVTVGKAACSLFDLHSMLFGRLVVVLCCVVRVALGFCEQFCFMASFAFIISEVSEGDLPLPFLRAFGFSVCNVSTFKRTLARENANIA